ncbi:histidine-rich glycoprotein [Biomphalaria pfeifferi]|uniref:Histidine-rich glycoprotein n=1 Tax=Biomphalaria pfeifferi TaxID=112525 RepID=A0AAD8F6X6_BIOPF|nr:histidine-rich glycoprotein [Biomphalaria pfeifferi]
MATHEGPLGLGDHELLYSLHVLICPSLPSPIHIFWTPHQVCATPSTFWTPHQVYDKPSTFWTPHQVYDKPSTFWTPHQVYDKPSTF